MNHEGPKGEKVNEEVDVLLCVVYLHRVGEGERGRDYKEDMLIFHSWLVKVVIICFSLSEGWIAIVQSQWQWLLSLL